MKYLDRHLEGKFIRMSSFFKVVLVTGARQVGKTTMLKHLAMNQERTYVTLDNLMIRELAQNDPELFFQTYKPPIIIDEIQYAPELFRHIKIMCDESEETGRFWITGSQQYSMMKNVRESLAGRLGILELFSLSSNEKDENYKDDFIFELEDIVKREKLSKTYNIHDVYKHIWGGGMPQVINSSDEMRNLYFESYINTYLMRDIAEIGGISDTVRFSSFIVACCALIGQQLNYKTLADAVGISQPTAKEWTRLLQGMGIIYLLKPYANNELKRLSKTPKLYFLDTGLCAFLSLWPTSETLMIGASSGHFFENYIVIEVLKNLTYSRDKFSMTYYRDSNAKEIDLIIEANGKVHPIEIKKSANPDSREVKKFKVMEKAVLNTGIGGVVCMCQDFIPINTENYYIPCGII